MKNYQTYTTTHSGSVPRLSLADLEEAIKVLEKFPKPQMAHDCKIIFSKFGIKGQGIPLDKKNIPMLKDSKDTIYSLVFHKSDRYKIMKAFSENGIIKT